MSLDDTAEMMNSPAPQAKLIAGGALCNGDFGGQLGDDEHGVPDAWAAAERPVVAANDPLSPREALLAAAGRAVVATFRDPLDRRVLPPPARAALLLLESALEPYFPASAGT